MPDTTLSARKSGLTVLEGKHCASAAQRDDAKAVGFCTRNAVSAILIRLDSLISQIAATQDPGEPRLTP